MTVAELIDELNKVEDKSKEVFYTDSDNEDVQIERIIEDRFEVIIR